MTEDPHDDIRELAGLHPGEPGDESGEVSAVNLGANPGAHIVMLKARDNGTATRAIVLAGDRVASEDRDRDDHEEATVPKGKDQTPADGGAAGSAGAGKAELLLKLDPEQRKEIEALIKSSAEAAAKPLADKIAALEKQNAELQAEHAKNEETEAFAASLPEAMRAAFLGMSEDEQAAYMAQSVAMAAAGQPDPLAKIAKAMDEQARKNAELETSLAKMRDEQDQAAAVKKFAPLGKVVKVEDFARHYRKVAKADQEAADYFAQTVTALAAQERTAGLFSVVGSDGDAQGAGTGSAMAKIETAAAKYQEQNPGTSKAAAVVAVCKANPELHREHIRERKSA